MVKRFYIKVYSNRKPAKMLDQSSPLDVRQPKIIASSQRNSFCRTSHLPPRFTRDGKEVEVKNDTVLARQRQSLNETDMSMVKVPAQWTLDNSQSGRKASTGLMTQSKLLMQRKIADLPHASFDIDGDGHVSMTDLFLAKRFDADKDGKLNTEELAAAKEALNHGYKDQFMFGLERCGPIQSSL